MGVAYASLGVGIVGGPVVLLNVSNRSLVLCSSLVFFDSFTGGADHSPLPYRVGNTFHPALTPLGAHAGLRQALSLIQDGGGTGKCVSMLYFMMLEF